MSNDAFQMLIDDNTCTPLPEEEKGVYTCYNCTDHVAEYQVGTVCCCKSCAEKIILKKLGIESLEELISH